MERSPVGAIQNVLLSRHGFIWRSPQRKQPGGRRELRLTERGQRLGGYPTNCGELWGIVGNSEFLTRYDSVKSRHQAAKTRSHAAKTRSHAAKYPEYPGMASSTKA